MKSNKKLIYLSLTALLMIVTAVFFYMRQEEIDKKTAILKIDRIEDVKGLGYSGQRKIAIDGNGNIFVAYRKKYQGKSEIFVAKTVYTEKGWTVSGTAYPISAVGSDTEQRVPSIAVDSKNNIHVVWYGSDSDNQINNRQIKYSRSENGGKSWSNWINISYVDGFTNKESYWQEHPHILAGTNNELFIFWEGKDKDNQNQQIKFSGSSDSGKTWSPWKNVQATPNSTQSRPTLVQDKTGRLYLFAYSSFGNTNNKQQIIYSWTDSQGKFWSQWQSISDPHFDSRHMSAATDQSGKIFVAWRTENSAGQPRIVLRFLENGKWSEIQPVTISQENQFFPSIGIGASGQVDIVWMESSGLSSFPNEDPRNGRIYLSIWDGKIFSVPEEISTGSINLYPNIPEIFGADGPPIVYESGLNGGNYDLTFRMLK